MIVIRGYFKDGSHRFENGLDTVWCVIEREGVKKGDPKLVGLTKWKMGVLCAEMGKVVEAIHLDGEDQESTLGT